MKIEKNKQLDEMLRQCVSLLENTTITSEAYEDFIKMKVILNACIDINKPTLYYPIHSPQCHMRGVYVSCIEKYNLN